MPDYTKILGVSSSDIVKIDGVSIGNVAKVSGMSAPLSGPPTATKWIVGATNGRMYKTTVANAGSGWSLMCDLGAGNGKSIAIGQDNSGNKRWAVHRSTTGAEISVVNDGNEDTAGNWTDLNLNNHVGADGGPSVAWGNNYWVGAGDDVAINPAPSDEDVLFASSDGGDNWSTVSIAAQQTNDVARTVCYKDSTTFFFAVSDQIWKATADPTNASNWSSVQDLAGAQDIFSMAYDGSSRWVCVGGSGEVHTSDDDWAKATSRTGGHGTSTIHGVVYCAGTVNKWITAGAGGIIAYSSDGVSWTEATTPITTALRAIATDHTTIVAVGDSGAVLTSADGINWSQVIHNPSINYRFHSIACDVIGAGMR